MSQPQPDDQDDKPLDPQMEKVRRKMVRLLAVSIGIMFVGVMAVLFAIVYKLSSGEPAETRVETAVTRPGSAFAASLPLPQGFEVVSVALDGGRVAFFGSDASGARRLLVFDAASGDRLGSIAIGAE